MKLSILICTMSDVYRIECLSRLREQLMPQVEPYKNEIEVVINSKGKNVPTGTKRNELIRDSFGKYFCFIDDDDQISNTYVEQIMNAIECRPDVVTFNGFMTTNLAHRVDFVIQLGERYEERAGKYYRWPNHLCPMKREKVKDVMFPDIRQGEDYQWSKAINDLGLLKTEVHIEADLYHYDFKSKK